MGKRNRRLRGENLRELLRERVGQEMHVLGRNGVTWSGKLEKVEPEAVVMRDPNAFWYNLKKKRHTIPFTDIAEVMVDEVSEW